MNAYDYVFTLFSDKISNLDSKSFYNFVIKDNLEEIVEKGDPKRILVNLKKTTFIDPMGMIYLLLFGVYLKTYKHRVYLFLPDDKEVLKTLKIAKFFQMAEFPLQNLGELFLYQNSIGQSLGIYLDKMAIENIFVTLKASSTPKVFKIECVTPHTSENRVWEIGNELKKWIKENVSVKLEDTDIESFSEVFNHILVNIPHHANSVGFATTRIFSHSIKIGIGDIGIGFSGSLKNNLKLRDVIEKSDYPDAKAIELAMAGYSEKYGNLSRDNSGLKCVQNTIKDHKGKLTIRSRKAINIISTEYGNLREFFIKDADFFPGTQIEVEILT